jgi:thiol:disulfide interchange protein DsbD
MAAPVSHAAAGDFLNYVYERETMLFAEITPPANLSADRVTLKAKATWQACDPMTCVPGAATVELPLATGRTRPANAELFAKWRAQIPKTNPPPFQIEWQRDKANEFTIRIVGLGKDFNAEFFPLPPSKEVKPGHPKLSDVADDGTRTITFPIEEGGAPNLPWEGVIATSKEGAPREGWHVAAAGQVSESASTARPAPPAVDGSTAAPTSLLAILWGAFVGGLILNLMPCVLPVIALKIFGFISQANEEPRRVFHLGLAFAAGVLVFFLGLAALAIGLRAAGHGFFWGMQFSDPRLLIGLISLVVLFALSMFGAFDITLGGATENTIGKLAGRGGYSGAFVHGLFTTLLGTSCTAPFVGPVLGLAVTQPPVVIVAIFATMAAGMSLPYVLLTWKPAWMRFLPKPGVWMERFKQLMGFVLLAVAIWLLGVVGSTRGATAMTAVAWFLTFLAVAAWIFGAGQRRWWAVVLALMVASAGGAVFLPDAMKKKASPGEREIKPNSVGIVWEPYSEGRLEEARKAGPAFIDFTAEWCPNCKANEKFVINTKPVADAFKAKRVTTLVADWTDFDPAITAKIKSFQRIGVPVYVLYPPGAAQPVVLPEFLTQAMLLRYLADLPD